MTMILGLVEHDSSRLSDLSLEMLTFGRKLAAPLNETLEAVLIGDSARPLVDGLAKYGVAVVHLAKHHGLSDYAPGAWAQCVIDATNTTGAKIVLAAASDRSAEVLAHAAARANLPMVANVTEVMSSDPFVVVRQRWGGSLLEEARVNGAAKVLTVAPHAYPIEEAPVAGVTVKEFAPALSDKDFRVRVTGRVDPPGGKVSLAEAKVVVGGGRGVGSAEGFAKLEELAALLGGAVGCSRAVTSLGWRPHQDQVGQTGTRIAPEVYIACGVSGATQHMVGAKGAKRILAVNTDPEATIVSKADWAIIGDLHEVIPAITAEIRKARAQ